MSPSLKTSVYTLANRPSRRRAPFFFFLTALLALGALCLMSMMVGSRMLTPAQVIEGLLHPSTSAQSLIMWKLRVPRTLTALFVGTALALAGVLMQGLTRNPLAEPGLLGVNSGAAAAVVLGVAAFGIEGPGSLWLALLGAGLATSLVFFIGIAGARGSLDATVRLVLAGIALSACLSAVTGTITMFNTEAFDSFRFWVVGSVEGRDLAVLTQALPFAGVGLLLGFVLTKPLSALMMGDDSAASLGVPVPLVRGLTILAVLLLCGTATAVAGPLSFVGLVVPHVARLCVGVELPRVLPLALVGGPALVLAADILGRVIAPPSEIEAGIVTAFCGAPVLLALVLSLDRERKPQLAQRRLGTGQKKAGHPHA